MNKSTDFKKNLSSLKRRPPPLNSLSKTQTLRKTSKNVRKPSGIIISSPVSPGLNVEMNDLDDDDDDEEEEEEEEEEDFINNKSETKYNASEVSNSANKKTSVFQTALNNGSNNISNGFELVEVRNLESPTNFGSNNIFPRQYKKYTNKIDGLSIPIDIKMCLFYQRDMFYSYSKTHMNITFLQDHFIFYMYDGGNAYLNCNYSNLKSLKYSSLENPDRLIFSFVESPRIKIDNQQRSIRKFVIHFEKPIPTNIWEKLLQYLPQNILSEFSSEELTLYQYNGFEEATTKSFYGSGSSLAQSHVTKHFYQPKSSSTKVSYMKPDFSSIRKSERTGRQLTYQNEEEEQEKDNEMLVSENSMPLNTGITPDKIQIYFEPNLKYKLDNKKTITITNDDFKCLYDSNWINDTLVDFFIAYYLKCAKDNQVSRVDGIEIFNSFFYTSLARAHPEDNNYLNVKSWFKIKADLFNKDFIIIPIMEDLHWYLIIISDLKSLKRKYTRVSKMTDETSHETEPVSTSTSDEKQNLGDDIEESEETEIQENNVNPEEVDDIASEKTEGTDDVSDKFGVLSSSMIESTDSAEKDQKSKVGRKPATAKIWILDSLNRKHTTAVENLKRFIIGYGKDKYDFSLGKNDIQEFVCHVTRQKNFNDCGLFTIFNVEMMFRDPLEFSKIILKKTTSKKQSLLARKESKAFFESNKRSDLRGHLRDKLIDLLKDQVRLNNGDIDKVGTVTVHDKYLEDLKNGVRVGDLIDELEDDHEITANQAVEASKNNSNNTTNIQSKYGSNSKHKSNHDDDFDEDFMIIGESDSGTISNDIELSKVEPVNVTPKLRRDKKSAANLQLKTNHDIVPENQIMSEATVVKNKVGRPKKPTTKTKNDLHSSKPTNNHKNDFSKDGKNKSLLDSDPEIEPPRTTNDFVKLKKTRILRPSTIIKTTRDTVNLTETDDESNLINNDQTSAQKLFSEDSYHGSESPIRLVNKGEEEHLSLQADNQNFSSTNLLIPSQAVKIDQSDSNSMIKSKNESDKDLNFVAPGYDNEAPVKRHLRDRNKMETHYVTEISDDSDFYENMDTSSTLFDKNRRKNTSSKASTDHRNKRSESIEFEDIESTSDESTATPVVSGDVRQEQTKTEDVELELAKNRRQVSGTELENDDSHTPKTPDSSTLQNGQKYDYSPINLAEDDGATKIISIKFPIQQQSEQQFSTMLVEQESPIKLVDEYIRLKAIDGEKPINSVEDHERIKITDEKPLDDKVNEHRKRKSDLQAGKTWNKFSLPQRKRMHVRNNEMEGTSKRKNASTNGYQMSFRSSSETSRHDDHKRVDEENTLFDKLSAEKRDTQFKNDSGAYLDSKLRKYKNIEDELSTFESLSNTRRHAITGTNNTTKKAYEIPEENYDFLMFERSLLMKKNSEIRNRRRTRGVRNGYGNHKDNKENKRKRNLGVNNEDDDFLTSQQAMEGHTKKRKQELDKNISMFEIN